MSRLVTCINKRPSHYDPHERIQSIGGPGWKDSEDQAIRNVKRDSNAYHVSKNGRTVRVVAAIHNGRDYLKTESDAYRPDNLLALPECP